jgi:hypothetical protein
MRRPQQIGLLVISIIMGGCTYLSTQRMIESGRVTDRFTQAIAQLEDPKLERRLGAIYALERIARDSEDAHGPVMEILTAYVREHPSCQEVHTDACPISVPGARGISAENQAVLRVLGRRARTYGNGETEWLDLKCSCLSGTKLTGAHLEGVRFFAGNLAAADLSGAHLEKAILSFADLSWANLAAIHLEGALLVSAKLGSANLTGAHLQGAHLLNASLRGAKLTDADIEGTDLRKVAVSHAQIKSAKNWDQAFYDREFLAELGLPPDHNERLAEKHMKERRDAGLP